MAKRTRIGRTEIKALEAHSEIWDTVVLGFGARRQSGKSVSFVVLYRTPEGRQRRVTIGKSGKWTPDEARTEAKRIIGAVAAGEDPAAARADARKAALTMSELCDDYLAEAQAGRLLTRRRVAKKASTLATDKGRIEQHIKPLLGRNPVAAVTRDDVETFMHSVAEGRTAKREKSGNVRGLTLVTGGKGTASRTVGLLGAIFTYAIRKNLRADNPTRGVLRFADGQRERHLTDEEYRKLGKGLAQAATQVWPPAIAAARFLTLTGWRKGEALSLLWSEVDLERRIAILPDTKTGRSFRPLSAAACAVLDTLPRSAEVVFQASRGNGQMSGFPRFFARILAAAGLPDDITAHVLRHSFASVASGTGLSESTIGALIGHRGQTITARYIHTADAVLLAAADQVAKKISEMMGD